MPTQVPTDGEPVAFSTFATILIQSCQKSTPILVFASISSPLGPALTPN